MVRWYYIIFDKYYKCSYNQIVCDIKVKIKIKDWNVFLFYEACDINNAMIAMRNTKDIAQCYVN